MSKITLTYEFDTHNEMIDFMGKFKKKDTIINLNPKVEINGDYDPEKLEKAILSAAPKQTLGEELEEDAAKALDLNAEFDVKCVAPPVIVPLPPPPPVVAPEQVDLDVNGLPWDERIHSGNHKTTQKGEWARRRGITDELKAQVEAEIRRGPAPEPQVEQPAPVTQAPPPPVVKTPQPAQAPPPPPTTEPPVNQFELLQRLNAHFEGSVEINAFLDREFGHASMPAMIGAAAADATVLTRVSDKLKEISGA